MAKKRLSQAEQSARFREAAKKAEVGNGKAFERAFKKVVQPKKMTPTSKK